MEIEIGLLDLFAAHAEAIHATVLFQPKPAFAADNFLVELLRQQRNLMW